MKQWPTKPIGEFVEERTERLHQGAATIYSVTNENGFVPSLDLFDKQVFSSDTGSYKRVDYHDLAYNPSRINVGSVAVCEDKRGGAVSPMYVIVRCNPGLLPRYLLYFLKSEVGLTQIRHRCEGAVRFQLKFRDLCAIPISSPPVAEQERVVKLLDEVHELQKLRAQADRRTTDLLAALFHQMFGDPVTNSKGWPVSRIGDICEVITGNTPPRANAKLYGSFIEWVKTDNIDTARGIIHRSKECLSEDGAKLARLVPSGSIVVTCIAGSLERIGDAAIADRKVAINQQINALIPSKQIEGAFLWQLTRALSRVIQGRATGVMTRIINKSTLQSIDAICPPLTLQRSASDRLVLSHVPRFLRLSSRAPVFNFFLFNHFRPLLRNEAVATPFSSIACALLPVQRGGRVSSLALLLSTNP